MRIKRSSLSELSAERIIRRTLLETNWVLYRERRVDSILDKDRHLSTEEYRLYSRGSFDFVVQHEDEDEPAFAIEFDGPQHAEPIQAARDIIKNRLCAEAGLPLIRIGFDELRERDEISVLEWLIQRFIVWNDDTPDAVDEVIADVERADGKAAADEYRENPEEIVGILAAQFSSDFPFPANAEIARRLHRRFGISLSEPMDDYEPDNQAPYSLEVKWPGTQELAETTATTYTVCQRPANIRSRADPAAELFTTSGRARFAFRHRTGPGPEDFSEPELDWLEPDWITMDLALYDALSKVERWAETNLPAVGRLLN